MAIIRVLVSVVAVAHAFRHRNATERVEAHATKNQTQKLASPFQNEALPTECKQMLQTLQTSAMQSFSHKCDDQGNHSNRVINALQKDDRKLALAEATEMFEKCGKFSKTCAEKMAPGLVEEVRLSGATVSDECRAQTDKVQDDKDAMKSAAECDQKEKFSEKVMESLGKDDLMTAVDAAEQSLTTCMKLSKKCAHQVAPLLVNSVVMRAMEESAMEAAMEAQQVPILVIRQPVLVIVEPGKDMSLLSKFATKPSVHKSPSFLQQDQKSRTRPWVSRLVVDLALKNA